MIKVAVMGYGTIGSGVAEILDQNRDVIAGQAGQDVELKYVLDLRDFPDSPVADKIVHDFKVIEQDGEVDVYKRQVYSWMGYGVICAMAVWMFFMERNGGAKART